MGSQKEVQREQRGKVRRESKVGCEAVETTAEGESDEKLEKKGDLVSGTLMLFLVTHPFRQHLLFEPTHFSLERYSLKNRR